MSKQEELVKVYITKYALTDGIMEKTAEFVDSKMIRIPSAGGGFFDAYYHKPYFSTDREDAVKQAEKMRVKAIASAKKKLAALEAMKF